MKKNCEHKKLHEYFKNQLERRKLLFNINDSNKVLTILEKSILQIIAFTKSFNFNNNIVII